LDDIKQKYGFYPMRHEEGGVASQFAGGGAVGPECEGGNCQPARVVAIARFEDGFADGAVLSFNDAICLQVVCQDAYVPDTVLVL